MADITQLHIMQNGDSYTVSIHISNEKMYKILGYSPASPEEVNDTYIVPSIDDAVVLAKQLASMY